MRTAKALDRLIHPMVEVSDESLEPQSGEGVWVLCQKLVRDLLEAVVESCGPTGIGHEAGETEIADLDPDIIALGRELERSTEVYPSRLEVLLPQFGKTKAIIWLSRSGVFLNGHPVVERGFRKLAGSE